MRSSEYDLIYQLENRHFFYVSLHQLVLLLIKKYYPLTTKSRVLDAGCGTGMLASYLSKIARVSAIDAHPKAVAYTSSRGVKASLSSVNKLPFQNNYFDVITCLDVIYHKKVIDYKALAEFYRTLKPGGILIIRVPAYQFLYRLSDVHVHTRQRYDYQELRSKLKTANFTIRKLSFMNILLFPFALGQKLIQQLKHEQDSASPLPTIPPIINKFISAIFMFETRLLQHMDFPFGLGLIAVVQKPIKLTKL